MRLLELVAGAVLTVAGMVAAIVAAQAKGPDEHFEKSLLKLDPSARLEQLCDYTALAQIRKDRKESRPDRAVANAMAEPQVTNDTVEAKAGAFRSRKKWYTLTYRCTANPDHTKVLSFKYEIGAEIPQPKWAAYGLWN
jgi:hypothetical protein